MRAFVFGFVGRLTPRDYGHGGTSSESRDVEIFASHAADPTLGGFIVDDDKCEPFTPAPETSDFVRETHAAVRAFNSWVPTDEQQAQARQFIIRQEERASRIDDELRFDKNMPPISYNRPTSGTHAK